MPNALANLALIAVSGGGVDVSIADAESRFDSTDRLVGWRLENAEAEDGHLDAVVQREGGSRRGHESPSQGLI